ncbi:MAG: fibronectin type III domain-containing protein [Sulfurimonas sp.]|nr:fibronectin type III domain-containing protein [Sulfurimonas sp.]
MNAIAFEWKAIKDERVKGIYIYKQSMEVDNGELEHYKTLNNRFATHYLDREIKPNSSYTYGFKTFSKDAESKMSSPKVLKSLPVLQSVSWIKSIQNMPRTAKIIWRPHTNQKVKSYIIQRRTLKDTSWVTIATSKGRLNAEFIDRDLKDDYVYKYRVRVLTYDGITSSPSDIVQVVTKSLPISIKNITATSNQAKKIEINWDKSKTEDFALYYLYKSEESDGSYKLIAKLHNNTFVDAIEEDGKEFFYRVSAVEKNGLESINDRLSIQGITLAKPAKPSLLEASLIKNKIEIKWKSKDSRVKSFLVIKKSKSGWFDAKEEVFTGIKGSKFVDAEIGPNIDYSYIVYAVDKFSIKSKPSIEINFKTPKIIKDNRKKEVKSKKKKSSTKKEKELIIPNNDFN